MHAICHSLRSQLTLSWAVEGSRGAGAGNRETDCTHCCGFCCCCCATCRSKMDRATNGVMLYGALCAGIRGSRQTAKRSDEAGSMGLSRTLDRLGQSSGSGWALDHLLTRAEKEDTAAVRFVQY